jgi:hypothetical protein
MLSKSTFVSLVLEKHFCRSSSSSSLSSSSSFVLVSNLVCSLSAPRASGLVAQRPHTRTVRCIIRRVNTPVMLLGMLLNVLPHLLDGQVERVMRLVLLVDEVVRVVCGLMGYAAGLGGGTGWCGERGCAGGGEGEDAGVAVKVVHFGGLSVLVRW